MISKDAVRHIADLAQLHLSAEDETHYAGELSRILAFMEQLDRFDVSAIEPMTHPLNAVQRLRADAVSESDQHEALQALAPAISDAFYTVPKIIE